LARKKTIQALRGGEGNVTLERLVEEAIALPPVSAAAAARYLDRGEAMAGLVNAELQARSDLAQLIGGSPLQIMFANHANHAEFMATVFSLGQNALLARTLPWVYRAYRGRGFSYDYFPVELEAWIRAVGQCLTPGEAAGIEAVYRWMLQRHLDVVRLADVRETGCEGTEPVGADKWGPVRERYLAALLAGDVAQALEIARAISLPGDLEGFFLSVIQPAMYAIGARWETGELSIAHEHLASAITGRVVAGLSMARGPSKPWRGRAIVSAAPNEFHELGAWMLSDLLELDGWDVSYLGANTPKEDLVALVRRGRPAFLALSVTMSFNLEKAKALIAAVKEQPAVSPVRVIVGGRAFGLEPGLWKTLGADAWAENARDAIIHARAFGVKAAP
jgi:methanogenic corrinoid protein MtbC1